MNDQNNAGMDPISVIAQAVGSIFNSIGGIITSNNQLKLIRWSKMPEWLSPADFYSKDNTLNYISVGVVVIIVILVIAIAYKASK